MSNRHETIECVICGKPINGEGHVYNVFDEYGVTMSGKCCDSCYIKTLVSIVEHRDVAEWAYIPK